MAAKLSASAGKERRDDLRGRVRATGVLPTRSPETRGDSGPTSLEVVMLLRKTFRFEASHILPKHPGKCSRLHGHSWVLHVSITGPINRDTGFVMDYAD